MKKILLIDDEDEIRELLQRGIQRHNYEVWAVGSGDEAVALTKEQSFDLMLIDIAMPGMDGYETCRVMREDPKTSDIPVVFLTGKDLDPRGMEQRFEDMHASGYLQKPVALEDILATIKKLLG